MRFELMIAMRYLRARRKDAFISVTTLFTAVGVTIGVAALVVMLAVMSGFETNLRERMLSRVRRCRCKASAAQSLTTRLSRAASTIPPV